MRLAITLIFCLVMVSGALAQERTVTITPLSGPVLDVDLSAPAGVCVMGNTNPAAWAIGDWIYGAETYATVFEAMQPPCGCPAGFSVEAVHALVQFGVEDVPITFDVAVAFHETVVDEAAGCLVPGPEVCSSSIYSVTIDAAGLYDLALPIDPTTCQCTFFGYGYAVSMTFVDAFIEYPDMITDNFPVGCTSWNDYGLGWLDLQSFGFPGEINISADIVCCEPAVPNEDRSWGGVKSLFR